jgi:hypothetical protein
VWTGSDSLEEAFSRIEHVEDIPAVLFGYLGARLERMLLFSTRATSLLGWDARGPRLRRETVETIVLSLIEASVLRSACEHGMPFLGALPFGDVEESLLVKLGGVWPQHVVLWPVRARGRTVALFYGEARSVDELRAVRDPVARAVACTESALERIAGPTEAT